MRCPLTPSPCDRLLTVAATTRLFAVRHRERNTQVADKESKLAAAATTLYNLARAVAPKFTDDTPEWS